MKYTYAYKTSDGVRHEETMNAASREEVFTALRAKGIKAIKVVAADGSKANGEIRGLRKRVVVSLLLLVSLGVGVAAYFTGTKATSDRVSVIDAGKKDSNEGVVDIITSEEQIRRQVIGDIARIEKGIANGWSDVFELEGDRFFASFAIPGVKAGQRNTSEKEFKIALNSRVESSPSDSIEERQIKVMVEGMKKEARAYIKAGGTIVEYGKRLTERQDAEIAIYQRIKRELENAKGSMSEDEFMDCWEKRNEELRNLGLKTIGLE